jgi:uncharacterized protein YgiM (DUF1202 family)
MCKHFTVTIALVSAFIFTNFATWAQTSSMPGYISGDNVNLRVDHTTQAASLGILKKGQPVYIISSFRPTGNDNEAILRVSTDFYDETFGYKLFSLPKGKAVIVNGLDDNQYRISFRNEKSGKMGFAKIDTHRLEFIGGETWFLVEIDPSQSKSSTHKVPYGEAITGWVFGKYVAYY